MVKPTQDRSGNDIASGHHIVVGGTEGDALVISLMSVLATRLVAFETIEVWSERTAEIAPSLPSRDAG